MFNEAACFKLRHVPELRCSPRKIKEAARFASRFYLKYWHLRTVEVEIAFEDRRVAFFECPDVGQELKVRQWFWTTFRHIRPHSSIVAHDAPGDACEADHTWQTHPDHDVRSRQADIESRGIAPVQHPAVACDYMGYDAILLRLIALPPIRQPADIAIDREILAPKNPDHCPRQSGLSCTRRPDNQHAGCASQQARRTDDIIDIVWHLCPLTLLRHADFQVQITQEAICLPVALQNNNR